MLSCGWHQLFYLTDPRLSHEAGLRPEMQTKVTVLGGGVQATALGGIT